MIEQKIRQSLVVDRVIPEYVREEFPRFAEFIREYYRWLDQDGNTGDMLAKFLSNKDIQTVDSEDHAFFILNTFLNSIPKNLEIDYKLLVQNIKSFYSERGTEDSIKTFFYLLSEARKPNSVVIDFPGLEDALVGKVIYGSNSGSKATILSATRISPSSSYVTITIQYSTEVDHRGRFLTSSDTISIDGQSYRISVEDFNVNVFYPKDHILRASDGDYGREYRCRIKFAQGEYVDYTNKSFTTSSGSMGRIQRQSSILGRRDGYEYYELTLGFTKTTTWELTETIDIEGSQITPVPVFTGVEVVDGGIQYSSGERFNIKTDSGQIVGSVGVTGTCKCRVKYYDVIYGGSGYQLYDRFQLRYSDGLYGAGYVSSLTAGSINELRLEFTRENSDEYPEVVFDSGNQSAQIYLFGDQIGAIKAVSLEDVGFDVSENSFVDLPTKPFPLRTANLRLSRGTLYRTVLSPKTERGTLSSFHRLQDNFYWQDFSYVLRFNRSFDFNQHFDLFKTVAHPAGTKVFFEHRRSASGAPDIDLRTQLYQNIKLYQERTTSKTIGELAYDEIGSQSRLKDVITLMVFPTNGYVRENNKRAVFDSMLHFQPSMTIDELSDLHSTHKYTCTIDVHPVYVQQTI